MHGRIKTISTAEQKVLQEKKREAKLKAYQGAYKIIQQKRGNKDYDDEARQLSQDVLLANPDIISLWNFRREIFSALKNELEEDNYQARLENELMLTEQCLRVNPKSYGSWHHRQWVLCNLPKCDWQKEVALCNKYLALDERNFHCWDYRRHVVKNAEVTVKSEYDYTTEKIQTNFSNYSAWHYRSKLLPLLFPDPEGKFPVAENTHKEELELVQNAAFTDPNDQSAWFYQRWLLGLRQPPLSIVCAYLKSNSLVTSLSRAIRLSPSCSLDVSIGGSPCTGLWEGTAGLTSSVWIFTFSQQIPCDASVLLVLQSSEEPKGEVSVEISSSSSLQKSPPLSANYSSDLTDVLKEQLQCCQQLLELEPESKWTLLTCGLLMQLVDLQHYRGQVLATLQELIKVDPLRTGYYEDMLSKVKLQLRLCEDYQSTSISLSGESLTSLYHTQYLLLVERVDLSDNRLKASDLKHLHSLVNCIYLNLNSNQITTLKWLPILHNLEELSLKENPLNDVTSEKAHFRSFNQLKAISFPE